MFPWASFTSPRPRNAPRTTSGGDPGAEARRNQSSASVGLPSASRRWPSTRAHSPSPSRAPSVTAGSCWRRITLSNTGTAVLHARARTAAMPYTKSRESALRPFPAAATALGSSASAAPVSPRSAASQAARRGDLPRGRPGSPGAPSAPAGTPPTHCGTPPPRTRGRPALHDRPRYASRPTPARGPRPPVASRLLLLTSLALPGRRGRVRGRGTVGAHGRHRRVVAGQHGEIRLHARILRPPLAARLPHLLRPEPVAREVARQSQH